MTTDEKRALAAESRRRRAARIAELRFRVVATALATFALAVGVVAYDGSMGQATPGSSSATTALVTDTPSSTDTSSSTDTASGDTSAGADVVTTHQS
jgi:hypothetical protein